jgi:hypothetical protein
MDHKAGKAGERPKGEKSSWGAPLEGPKKAPEKPQKGKSGPGEGVGRGGAGKAGYIAIKTERLPDGRTKTILKEKATGRVVERIE